MCSREKTPQQGNNTLPPALPNMRLMLKQRSWFPRDGVETTGNVVQEGENRVSAALQEKFHGRILKGVRDISDTP